MITNKHNGKIYVGSATDFWRRYLSYRNCGSIDDTTMVIYRAMQKHGFDNFVFDILEVVEDKNALIAREQAWIDRLQPFGSTGVGYNVCPTAGSRLGVKHTDESKQRMSESRKHVVYTDAWRTNLSKSARARIDQLKAAKSREVVKIDKATLDVISVYPSAKEAANHHGASKGAMISYACNRDVSSAYGYFWAWKADYDRDGFKPRSKRKSNSSSNYKTIKPVSQYTLEGELVRHWQSAPQAAKALSGQANCIRQCCLGKRKTAIGYKWEHVEDESIVNELREQGLREYEEAKIAETNQHAT